PADGQAEFRPAAVSPVRVLRRAPSVQNPTPPACMAKVGGRPWRHLPFYLPLEPSPYAAALCRIRRGVFADGVECAAGSRVWRRVGEKGELMFRRGVLSVGLLALVVLVVALPAAQATPTNVRLTNDNGSNGGYVSDYTMVTGTPYTDAFLTACSQSRGRQNEPAVAVDPRNLQVIVGSSN